ncbi:Flp pilus assembly complex ATPase component TadA [bacterium]|nr:Flp pilus assembly complex ATPase component TadA [bacterium]
MAKQPQNRKKIGQILIELNIINEDQLTLALDLQKRRNQKLGRILVDLGLMSEGTLTDVLSKQLGLRRIKLELDRIDNNVLKLLSEDVCKKYRVLPYAIEKNDLILVMDDPLNAAALEVAKYVSGYNIVPALVARPELDNAFAYVFSLEHVSPENLSESYKTAISTDAKETQKDKIGRSDIVKYVNMMILNGLKLHASTIHIEKDHNLTRIRYRVDGVIQQKFILPSKYHGLIVDRIKALSKMESDPGGIYESGTMRIGYQNKELILRTESIPTVKGENVILKFLQKDIDSFGLNSLGLNTPELKLLTQNVFKSDGLVVISGPRRSGKSTTVYSILKKINSKKKKIFTIEDYIEYPVPFINQIQIDNSRGATYPKLLKAVLELDPDVLFVGEIKDPETADLVIRASLTGHLVITTLHTNSTFEAVLRLIDLGVEPYLLVNTINIIVNQRLLRLLCPYCRIEADYNIDGQRIKSCRTEGCVKCGYRGYIGRTGVFEILPGLVINRDVFTTVPSIEALRNIARNSGLETLWQKGLNMVREGETSLAEIMRVIPRA